MSKIDKDMGREVDNLGGYRPRSNRLKKDAQELAAEGKPVAINRNVLDLLRWAGRKMAGKAGSTR